MKRIIGFFMMALVLLVAPAVHAFPNLYFWQVAADSANGGAGFLYGTGSTTELGVTCALCHIKAPGTLDTTVTPSPAWAQKNGSAAYIPGQLYTISVALVNETKGLGLGAKNLNGMVLTIENQAGQGVGLFTNDDNVANAVNTNTCIQVPLSPPQAAGQLQANLTARGATTYLISPSATGGKCYTVVSVNTMNLATWKFTWKAPVAGTGPVTIYYGAVDGLNGGSSSLQDDVKQGTVKLVEGP